MQLYVLDTNYQAILNNNLNNLIIFNNYLHIHFLLILIQFCTAPEILLQETLQVLLEENRWVTMPREFKLLDRNYPKQNEYERGKYHLTPSAWYPLWPEQAQPVHCFKSSGLWLAWALNWLIKGVVCGSSSIWISSWSSAISW